LTPSSTPFPTQLVSFKKTCDFEAIHQFAVLSDDFNPIHVDREFAATSSMGGIIAHGPMALGLLFQVLRASLDAGLMHRVAVDVYFRRPVRENDIIMAGGQLRLDQSQIYDIWVKNQNGETVVDGVVVVLDDGAARSFA